MSVNIHIQSLPVNLKRLFMIFLMGVHAHKFNTHFSITHSEGLFDLLDILC